jgi:hypothetical protein
MLHLPQRLKLLPTLLHHHLRALEESLINTLNYKLLKKSCC